MGFGLTPLALAARHRDAGQAPQIVTAAAPPSSPEQSPYIVRPASPCRRRRCRWPSWAAKNGIKKVATLVTDYGPGIDAEKAFKDKFTSMGGEVVAELRTPLRAPDFAPSLQRVKVLGADAVFVFVPAGFGAVFMKQYAERGLAAAGVKLIATGDVTDDDLLPGWVTWRWASSIRTIIPLASLAREQGLRGSLQEG